MIIITFCRCYAPCRAGVTRLLTTAQHVQHDKRELSGRRRTMKAWQVHQYGGMKEVTLSDSVRIQPIRNPTDVLVKVHAASVNVIDLRMMEGYGSTLMNLARGLEAGSMYSMEFPLVVGRDFSGVVVETGVAVSHVKPGDEVWGALWPQRQGTHAEFCMVPDTSVCKKPSNLSHVEAAAIPYAGLTAYGALSVSGELDETNSRGKRCLVLGGSGGVGTIAIQLLKAWGAEVVATCSSSAVPLLESLGTDVTIDYTSDSFHEELHKVGRFDLILNNVVSTKMDDMLPHLKPWTNAKYVTVLSPLLKNFDQYGLPLGFLCSANQLFGDLLQGWKKGSSCRWAFFIGSPHGLQVITKLSATKQVIPVIDKVFKFDEVPSAYEKMMTGHARGKTVIDVGVD